MHRSLPVTLHRALPLALGLTLLGATARAQVSPYGAGTAGAGGFVPVLDANDPALGNAAFAFSISNALGGVPAGLFFSLASASLPLPGGTTLLVDPFAPNFLFTQAILLGGGSGAPGAGSGSYPLPLPPTLPAALLGLPIHVQALVADLQPSGAVAATQGLVFRIRSHERVFVGTSVGGGVDPYWLIDPSVPSVVASGGTSFTDNVTDAGFASGGQDLFVASSLRNAIFHADLRGGAPVWSTFHASGSSAYGIGIDEPRQRLYTLTGANKELTALDMDPASSTYGQVLGTTTGLSSTGFVERWSLSPDGNTALVLTVFNNTVFRIDTDPASATYLQQTGFYAIPPTATGFRVANQVRITPDGSLALVLIQNSGSTPGEIHRLDLASGQWLDHDPIAPGIQAIGPSSNPPAALGSAPVGFALARSGRFAVATGFSGSGWAGRLDLDPANPAFFAFTVFNPGVSLAGAWACDLSRDQRSVYVGSFPNGELHVLDVASGLRAGGVLLPGASNVYTVRTN